MNAIMINKKCTVELLDHRVEADFNKLAKDMKANCLRIIELVEKLGPQAVGMPFVRPLLDKLWEIRFRGKGGIARAIYQVVGANRLIILHIFVKKRQTTPRPFR